MQAGVDGLLLLDFQNGPQPLLDFTRCADPLQALRILGETITANPLWAGLQPAVLAGRVHPYPLLAAFGSFSPTQRRLLQNLSEQLRELLAGFRYVDYGAAEKSVERLAERLIERFGPEELSRYRYRAMPRGGLFVLGMLSYLLGLRREQVDSGAELADAEGATVVVVDDCALSGLRFQQYLADSGADRVVFCPLFAPAELCRAIEGAEARVAACINGEDLRDLAPEQFGSAYQRWRAERRQLTGDQGYWIGRPEYVAFAWSEPQTNYWNAAEDRFEAGWSLLPRHLCLKHRSLARSVPGAAEGAPATVAGAVICTASGPLRPPARVLWTEWNGEVAVACMPTDPAQPTDCLRLGGSAASMWRAVIGCGRIDAAADALLQDYDVEPERLKRDLASFVANLQDGGILARA